MPRPSNVRGLVFLVVLAALPWPGLGSAHPDSREVILYLSVVAENGHLVTNLSKEHFRVFEDNVEQKIKDLKQGNVPMSVGILLDTSGSMSFALGGVNKLNLTRIAVVQFVKLAGPHDEFFLVNFNDQADLILDFTTDIDRIQSKLGHIEAKGRTSLFDAIYLAIDRMRYARNQRRTLIILSDGVENGSVYEAKDLKSLVNKKDVQIYAISIPHRFGSIPLPEETVGPYLLSDLAKATGGWHVAVNNPHEIPKITGDIGNLLQNQYTLSYSPTNPAKNGGWRKIKVRLNPPRGLPPLHVYAKTGYYAPTQ